MDKFTSTFSFNALMIFLNIGGLVSSIISLPTTWFVGVGGIAGGVIGVGYFSWKAYRAWKNNL